MMHEDMNDGVAFFLTRDSIDGMGWEGMGRQAELESRETVI